MCRNPPAASAAAELMQLHRGAFWGGGRVGEPACCGWHWGVGGREKASVAAAMGVCSAQAGVSAVYQDELATSAIMPLSR